MSLATRQKTGLLLGEHGRMLGIYLAPQRGRWRRWPCCS
jgi:hypothetical protein